MIAADAYLFVCPENLGSMSGAMKEFFDRNYYPLLDRLNGRPFAVIICAGSDGQGAQRQLLRIASGWRLKPVAEPLIVNTDAQTELQILAPKKIDEGALGKAGDIAAALASGLIMGIY